MRAVVQRVTKASVTVGDEVISSIGRGLCVLIGISRDDTPKDREYIARKILNLRVFDDDNGKRWNKNVKDKQFEILCVSQFTLYCILKGNKPDFHSAMDGKDSEKFYNEFLDMLRKDYDTAKIKDGKFGAHMQVNIQNDGPVTIQLESPVCEPRTPTVAAASPMKKVTPTSSRQSGCKTPVAVVKGQPSLPRDKSKEKASRYIRTIVRAFEDSPDIRKQFTTALKNYKETVTGLPELLLATAKLFHGQRELLCSFTQFLPPGHSIFIVNNDPTQVKIRLSSREPMSMEELQQYIEQDKQLLQKIQHGWKSGPGINLTPSTDQLETPTKVILWCTPRSMSTVLTKCLSFVPDSVIWFEPYMGAYRFGSDAQYPESTSAFVDLTKEIDLPASVGYDVQQSSYLWCKHQLEVPSPEKKVVFVKDMAHAIDSRYDAIPDGYKHTFLIRHPSKVLQSWKRGIYKDSDGCFESFKLSACPPSRVPSGFFFKEVYDLYNHIKEKYDSDTVVIDADDLMKNPSGILKAYCNSVGIPFNKNLLHWDPSSAIIETWNATRQSLQFFSVKFFAKALSSSEFIKPTGDKFHQDPSEDDLLCVNFCMPYYEKLYASRLQ